jgi:hypothetical protein
MAQEPNDEATELADALARSIRAGIVRDLHLHQQAYGISSAYMKATIFFAALLVIVALISSCATEQGHQTTSTTTTTTESSGVRAGSTSAFPSQPPSMMGGPR